MSDSEVGMWWFRPSPGTINFGDELGPEIVRRLGHKVRRVPVAEAELVSCGSILGLLPQTHSPNLAVWGSGFLLPTDRLKPKPKILALRGSLSANKIGKQTVLGDPGILVPLLWDYEWKPIHKVGAVIHYVDKKQYPWASKIINPTNPVDSVIKDILSCEVIASSSLHGLIVAEAYGIPTIRLYHPKVIGDEFKWVDYLSGLAGRPLSDVQQELIGAL